MRLERSHPRHQPGERDMSAKEYNRARRVPSRKSCVALLAGVSLLAPLPAASAENYPDRVIRIVQPFAAGGSTDVLARGLAQKLSEYLGQSVIVESRPGANGIIASQSVA